MTSGRRQPTPQGKVILQRLEEQSLSIAEVERRTPLTKNTISNAIYGPRRPQRKTIEILAETLDLPVEVLTRPGIGRVQDVRFERFSAWLFRTNNLSLWIGVVGALATAVILSRGLSSATSPLAHGVHFLVILLLLTRLPRPGLAPQLLEDSPSSLRLAATAAGDLRLYWGVAWVCWLFLYLGLTAGAVLGILPTTEAAPPPATRWLFVLLNLLQNSGTVMLLLSYEVVARPTVEEDLSRNQVLPREAWLAFAAVATILEAGITGVGVSWTVQQWFGWASGFAQGTALALFVGRLDSKYIDPPPLVVALLYGYAAIQGAWPVFRYEPELMLVLSFAALVLKCLLFLFVAWLFESRILLFYLARLRELDEEVSVEREEFLRRVQTRAR